jgi:DNA (cytosine-5)-methyltransferase 1
MTLRYEGRLRFIDLFAGLGGFHVALRRLGHGCVFACELDETLRDVYERNFGLRPAGDIREVDLDRLPEHDVLCAGFPCQPFSKAGSQDGFEDEQWGDLLFGYALEIASRRHPRYMLLENVPNFQHHRRGQTWEQTYNRLRALGYGVDSELLSPHRFGIPQIRERLFIVASRTGLREFSWPEDVTPDGSFTLSTLLDHMPVEAKRLPSHVEQCLIAWQDFLGRFPGNAKLPSFPIWSMEFGADYPFEDETPHTLGPERLRAYRGAHGRPLRELPVGDIMEALPSYARAPDRRFPLWKVQFIRQNRAFYEEHRDLIDPWLPQIRRFPSSYQKLEWNCQGEEPDIWRCVIQFRASGVRVKRPTTAPSLVAMTDTQVPIIGWERRYMTPRECARLQSLGELHHLPEPPVRAFKALGNAVNAELATLVARALLPPVPG